ncbi:hypothetical protein [Amorphus orientalis]|uniref:Glycerol-3-phosphate acyltransferase PlsY n=1 Tax=Amorphus orientalis TaxID=649198 RepID=A0AAE3VQ31_9HYPH|nr:hypothetical protein [Amorphus orientalis]MDQ0316070.1 glycerol-3-phosphate acyltransferase PlsY [Amorphus orientalis]
MATRTRQAGAFGAWLVCLAALLGLIVSAINAFSAGNGIAFTPGAYLVLVTSALLLVGSLFLAFGHHLPRWMVVVMAILVVLDILGTGFAAWLLETNVLLGAMIAAGIGWLIYIAIDPSRRGHSTRHAAQGA